jgi:hypothetical protein
LWRTSRRVKEQVDKMRLPAVVRECSRWRNGFNDRRSTWPNLIEKLEIVMNQLHFMTVWCRISTLKVYGLRDDLNGNCLGSDGVRRLTGVLPQCKVLRYLRLSSKNLGPAGAGALAGELAHCRALNHLDLSFNRIRAGGGKSLTGVLGQCTALTRLNLSQNGIGPGGAGKLAGVLGQYPALELLDLSDNSIGSVGNRRLYFCCTETLEVCATN